MKSFSKIMLGFVGFCFALLLMLSTGRVSANEPVVLVIHGGAGVKRADVPAEKEKDAREVLEQALRAGHAVLREGRGSLDAVEAAIVVLEDAPVFNAGRGSVLNADGFVEMDASIMDGRTRKAGAAAGVKEVRNPIRLARLVMEQTPHVLLIGAGGDGLARKHGLRMEAPEWFITPEQKERLERAKKKSSASLGVETADFIGTVGAVALDNEGHLAAGTSTGGMVNKLAGRVGDSPIIGAGTYAEDGVCGVSCTGHGEFFIRNVAAHEVAARMKHARADLKSATNGVIHEQIKAQGGTGGLIALDANGKVSTPFNTEGMFHAWITRGGEVHVAIFEE